MAVSAIGLEGVVREDEFDAIHGEVALVLLDERVLRFGEDADERVLIERLQADDHRQAADEFGDEAEFEQVVVGDVRACSSSLRCGAAEAALGLEAEADVVAGEALFDVVFEAFEGAAADEQDVLRC